MSAPRLPHYEILRRLGRGGMGEVWLARDERLDREVALKVLAPELADDPRFRQRFEREARSAAGLSHPGIVTIHAIEESDGLPVIAMEHVDGRPLSELIPAGGLPLARVLDLGIQLADAVAAAHEAGVTHRDLKPDNVMVEEGGSVRVLDFGLAKRRDRAGAEPTETDSDLRTDRCGIHFFTTHEPHFEPVVLSAWIAEQFAAGGQINIPVVVEVGPGGLVGLRHVDLRDRGNVFEIPVSGVSIEHAFVARIDRRKKQIERSVVVKIGQRR